METAAMLGLLADALAAAATTANLEGEDASTDKWAIACFGRAEGLRRARMMVLDLGTKLAPAPVMTPAGPAALPELIYPLNPTPENIAELGAACGSCGRVHDISGRITGDAVWCPCGATLTVRHPARVTQ